MKTTVLFVVTICSFVLQSNGLPTIYNIDESNHEANPVMIPVASTVIPLEDLPVFKVGLGFGLDIEKDSKNQLKKKPDNLKDLQLITTKNQHRFVAPAGVQELTKEEFEQFSLSRK